jgi:hypothetical protein
VRGKLDLEIASPPATLACAEDACTLRAGVRDCYETALASSPGLSGTLSLSIAVSPSGDVGAVTSSASAPALAGVAFCVRAAAPSIAFGCCPSNGSEAVVGLRIDLAPGPAASQTVSIRLRDGISAPGPRLPPEVILRVLRTRWPTFKRCYASELPSNPSLQGRVSVRFLIDRTGAVAWVGDFGSDIPDSAVTQCVLSTIHGLAFPAPEGGTVTPSYWLDFGSGG